MMSFSLFLALPAPLKVVAILVGGLFFTGFKRAQMPAQARQEVQIVPAEKPAKVIAAVLVKPAKPLGALGPVTITVNSEGSYNVGGGKLTENQLFKKLKAAAAVNPDVKILVKADALTPYQMVVSAVEISKKAGLKNVSFSAKSDQR